MGLWIPCRIETRTSTYLRVSGLWASSFLLVSLFFDVKKKKKKVCLFSRNSRQHAWAPEEAEEKCSILKSEPFDGGEPGRGWQMDDWKTTRLGDRKAGGEKIAKEKNKDVAGCVYSTSGEFPQFLQFAWAGKNNGIWTRAQVLQNAGLCPVSNELLLQERERIQSEPPTGKL